MALFIIVVRSKDERKTYADLGKHLSDIGDECLHLGSAWCVVSEADKKEIRDFLSNGIIEPEDQFIVAEVQGSWVGQNVKDSDECYENRWGYSTRKSPLEDPPRGFNDPGPFSTFSQRKIPPDRTGKIST